MYDKVAYISGPYRADTLERIEANITAAENEAIWWLSNGFAVICPHKNTRNFGEVFNEDKVLLPADEELVSRSDIIVMLPGWRVSTGSKVEHARARKEDKVILLKGDEARHLYRVSSQGRHGYDVTIAKGKIFSYPLCEEILWKELLERTKRS